MPKKTTISDLTAKHIEFQRELGRRGGAARAKSLTPARRKKIAQAASRARWDKAK